MNEMPVGLSEPFAGRTADERTNQFMVSQLEKGSRWVWTA